MKQKLLDYINENILFLDGAMGTQIINYGGANSGLSEELNITDKELIKKIHNEYLMAGSMLIYTNTFQANPLKFKEKLKLKNVLIEGIHIAKNEADKFNAYVALSVGSLGILPKPHSKYSLEDFYGFYKEIADIVKNENIDAVILETMSDLGELKMAILAFKENTDFPIFSSITVADNGRTFTGAGIPSFCMMSEALGVSAVGLNCSFGADKMKDFIPSVRSCTSLPIFVKPNAGIPTYKNGVTVYHTTPNEFANDMLSLFKMGVSMFGGCCGTTPEYIEKLIKLTKESGFELQNLRQQGIIKIDAVCSATEIVDLQKDLMVVGERINPTGKPLLKSAIINDNYEYIAALAAEQVKDGADILDLNVGMPNINQAEKLKNVVEAVQSIQNKPLQIDTTDILALEKALRYTIGIPIVNSVNADNESLDKVLPLVKKYGAYVIGLCLDKNGIPRTVEQRIQLAERIIDSALKCGISKERIIIDPLTMAVATDITSANLTLECVRELKKLGIKTILGISNISFGLPNREIVNQMFLMLAKDCGLSAAIINPNLIPAYNKKAYKLLMGEDENCTKYIEKYSKEICSSIVNEKSNTIEELIVKGLKNEGLNQIKKLVNNENFKDIIDNNIIKGLNILGDKYQSGTVYLPQLMLGADTAKEMLNYISSTFFFDDNKENKEIILLATVKGDVHDIGKNIVKAVLGNYGYRIVDLGKDVATEEIIVAVKKYKPKFIGLSALMTTTMDNMKESVIAIKKFDKSITILVGGAVITEDFAKSIGAIYCKDAQDAVRFMRDFQ